MQETKIDISYIVKNSILEELYEENYIDENTYHKVKEKFLKEEAKLLDK